MPSSSAGMPLLRSEGYSMTTRPVWGLDSGGSATWAALQSAGSLQATDEGAETGSASPNSSTTAFPLPGFSRKNTPYVCQASAWYRVATCSMLLHPMQTDGPRHAYSSNSWPSTRLHVHFAPATQRSLHPPAHAVAAALADPLAARARARSCVRHDSNVLARCFLTGAGLPPGPDSG